MAVMVEESDCERKKKRKSLHNERTLFDDGTIEVVNARIGSSMAVGLEDADSDGKRMRSRRKLLLHDKVEVRSVEEGLLGSWHLGAVIGGEYLVREVKYNDILDDRTGKNYVESVTVSSAIEGRGPIDGDQHNYRGMIRPLPPPYAFSRWSLHYGLCVDVYHEEAWWEGVIFDHEDGSEMRKVFFPDLGDEMTVGINSIRITQDWNQVAGTWARRGSWLFLELIEECEQDWPLNVSVQQIWYDVREKNEFEKVKEWTCKSNALWRELVLHVIIGNFRLTLNEVFCVLKPGEDCISPLGSDMLMIDEDANAINSINYSIGSIDKQVHEVQSNAPYHDQPQSLLLLPPEPNEISNFTSSTEGEGYSGIESTETKRYWTQVYTDILHGDESKSCSDAVIEYALISAGNRKPPSSLTEDVRKHLAHLGWKIEFMNNGIPRFRYTSLEGKAYLSLRQVCLDLREPAVGTDSPISQDDKRILLGSHDDISLPLLEKSEVSREEQAAPCHEDRVYIDQEYCPQAVINYFFLGSRRTEFDIKNSGIKSSHLKSKAKKHLSFMGWAFWYVQRKGKRELRYGSPKGKCYYSLRTACKGCMEEGGASEGISTGSSMEVINFIKESKVQELSATTIDPEEQKSLVQQSVLSEKWPVKSPSILQLKSGGTTKVRKKRHYGLQCVSSNVLKHQAQANRQHGFGIQLIGGRRLRPLREKNASIPRPKKRKGPKALMKLNHLDGNHSNRVLRSSKRARPVLIPGLSKNPRSILSWLIDSNMVLPRAKVHYSIRRDHHPMGEGRITRDGIKCSCCKKVFSLSRFEAHAGSSYHGFEAHAGSSYRPSAANIFLEDGRSLLECQRDMVYNISHKSFTKETCNGKKRSECHDANDYICSVCRYGGDLVLCDQCPSSFHKSCLGLKDLPEGDWFCPSCCCGVCGENKFNSGSENDNILYSCYQCEHQYHVGCLRTRGHVKLETHPKEAWFCSKQCKKIFWGLRKLLGKPTSVGGDNLTWTLLKPMGSDSFEIDVPGTEPLAEVYSKLNVALAVMHECFEPFKEPRTRRDLIEDVIFSRGSNLNRLNFRGFYTVLLERNDELISVAIIRVHGEKVAEIPLVGTRFQYRRLGMCRILMDELEKKLMELGVKRLTLPAVPSVLNTWTASFGFSKMTDSERLSFLDCTFLDFQDTVMCQKLLIKIPSTKSGQSTGTLLRPKIVLNRHSAASEVLEVEKVEESQFAAQRPLEITLGNSSNGNNNLDSSATQEINLQYKQCLNQNNLEHLLQDDGHEKRRDNGNKNGCLKFYERRRMPSSAS